LDAIEVVLIRHQKNEHALVGLVVDLDKGLVWYKGMPLELSRQQYELLAHLYKKEGAVCTSKELLKVVYDEDVPAGQASADKRLEGLIARIREKIEEDPSKPKHLLTVSGRGFRLEN
jgi:DNA-binding response OmpR family regulator